MGMLVPQVKCNMEENAGVCKGAMWNLSVHSAAHMAGEMLLQEIRGGLPASAPQMKGSDV